MTPTESAGLGRVGPAPRPPSLPPSPTTFFRALGPALVSSVQTAWLWTPGIALVALVPSEREICFSLTPLAGCALGGEPTVYSDPLPTLGWLHVVIALSALSIAAFLQVAVALGRAAGDRTGAALVDALPRLLRAWTWGIVLVPALLVAAASMETPAIFGAALLLPLPFYVGAAALPSLARGERHRDAAWAVLEWLLPRRILLTAFITGGLFFVTGAIVMLSYGVGQHLHSDAVVMRAVLVVGAHVLGVGLSACLAALARAHAR